MKVACQATFLNSVGDILWVKKEGKNAQNQREGKGIDHGVCVDAVTELFVNASEEGCENSGYQVNENALAQIHENAKIYDSLVKDQHYLMKTEITEDRACVVQFTTEQGKVMTTYTFFKAVISEDSKK